MDEPRIIAERILANVDRVIIGKTQETRLALVCLLARGHLLIEDVPGVGKTMLARALARSTGCTFARIQFTPDLLPSDVTGLSFFNQATRDFEFRRGPIFAQVVLTDEINRATPKTQSALLEAMQEGAVTVGRERYELPSPFFVMATQNPIEMEGTYPLPEAQLDRFFFKLRVTAPGRADLHAILERTTGADEPAVKTVLRAERVMKMRRLIREVPVARPVQDFVVRLIEATHPTTSAHADVKKFVRYGSSPRGAQAILLGAKVVALRAGRFSPSFEDVRRVVPQALRHRLLLNFEGEADGISSDQIIESLLKTVAEE